MEAKLKTDTLEYLNKKLDTAFTQEETAEIIVPDSMPDIIELVNTDGIVTVRSKEAENGRISFTGMVSADVIYRPENEERLCRLEASIPFTAALDAAEVTSDSRLCASIHIGSLDSRMINSRKALVKVDIVIEALAYEPAEFTWSVDLDDDRDAGVELLRDKTEVNFVTQVKEKAFVLTDEFTLPAGKPPIEELLNTGINITTEEIKSVGNKLIFKGEIRIDNLYIGSGETEPQSVSYSAPFSQIIEMESLTDDADYEIKLMLTSCYIDSGSHMADENTVIAVEMHMTAQAICRESFELPYISDVYSAKYDLSEEREEFCAEIEGPVYYIPSETRETVEVEEAVLKILDSHFSLGKVFLGQEDGALSLKMTVNASAMYITEGGRICGINRKFEIKSAGEYTPEMKYGVSARILSDAQAAPMRDSIEFWIPVRFDIRPSGNFKASAVTDISWDEEKERDMSALPSIVVHHAVKGESLWMMAKKYCSSKELIMEVNNMEEGMAPETGKLFIIPRKE